MSFPGDVMLVTNHSDAPLSFKYDGRTITVPPSKVGYVPFEFVVHELGHPAAGSKEAKLTDPYGNFHMVPSRQDEITRIQTKHNWNLGAPENALGTVLLEVPDFTVQDQDGEEIHTVAQDPEGHHTMTVKNQSVDVNDQIARMKRQLELLQAEAGLPTPVQAELVDPPSTPQESDLLTDDE